jgi:hypothetical protein
MRLDDLDRELRRYRRFYRRAAAAGDAVVVAPFQVTVDRFGEVIHAVNARFSTAFIPFDHHDPAAKGEVFEEMEREARSTPSELDRMWRIARPNDERKEATREMQARLTAPPYRSALARCQAVYDRLISTSTLS